MRKGEGSRVEASFSIAKLLQFQTEVQQKFKGRVEASFSIARLLQFQTEVQQKFFQ